MRNCKPQRRGTSKYKGVCWDKRGRNYLALITCDGRTHRIGSFEDEAAAARAYDRRAAEMFGEFAFLNFPEEVLCHRGHRDHRD